MYADRQTREFVNENVSIPRWVRIEVFRMTQHEFGHHIGLTPGRIAQFEGRGSFSVSARTAILALAKKRDIEFKKEWFDAIPMGGQK